MITKKIQALNTQETRVVTEIYRFKSIHKAAKTLNVTPNYVNVTLLRLELKLGCQLFLRRQKNRNGRGYKTWPSYYSRTC